MKYDWVYRLLTCDIETTKELYTEEEEQGLQDELMNELWEQELDTQNDFLGGTR